MTAHNVPQPLLGEKIALVGRRAELDDLKKMLLSRGDSHVVYYKAEGGVGKTRLLRELEAMVEEAGPGYLCTGIIDLYHTDNHSTSDVERIIVDRFDVENKYFQEYRVQRKLYTEMRERGTGEEMLEKMRQNLHLLLTKGWERLANDARKLVLIFDTVELLQYESTPVEEMAGLDSLDTRVKSWLLTVLPELKNILVVFAGRPKELATKKKSDKEIDHQARLEGEMRAAFSKKGIDVSKCPTTLAGLTLKETQDFLDRLFGPAQSVPADILPVIHHLTGGAPIFLHLIADLMQRLTNEYKDLIEWFREHANLVQLKEHDPELEKARFEVKTRIVRGIFNEADELGLYLSRIAMMPKGIDLEVLDKALGIPEAEALILLQKLENLSFVKRFHSQTKDQVLFENRLFLHDEMYQLLRLAGVVPDLVITERQIANTLVLNYYNPKISALEEEIRNLPVEDRDPKRRILQKLQVERLYYLMVQNPVRGFEMYKRLSDEANRQRFVGFSMRLHDEFLRFYNKDERRAQFERNGVPHDRMVRESAEMWIERFHWWGQYSQEITFAEKIFKDPGKMQIDPKKHADILGNIAALYGRAIAMTRGYDEPTVAYLKDLLEQLPDQKSANQKQLFTRARMEVSLGYLYDRGGRYSEATRYYMAAQTDFDMLGLFPDELAMLLNNLSFVYARQGRFERAWPLINRARRLNEGQSATGRSTGLTLFTMSSIEIVSGNHLEAIQYANAAINIFDKISDRWGQILGLRNLANAQRRLAKNAIRQGVNLNEAREQLENAQKVLTEAINLATTGGFTAQRWQLAADMGKLFREKGQLARKGIGAKNPNEFFEQSYACFIEALGWIEASFKDNPTQALANKAETTVDLAELLSYRGADKQAAEKLDEALFEIGPEYQLTPGKDLKVTQLVSIYFPQLGNVERLLGEIDLSQKDMTGGLDHMYRAFVYYNLFSATATEKQPIIDYVYDALLSIGVEERRQLIANLQAHVEQDYCQYEPTGFVETLRDLLA